MYAPKYYKSFSCIAGKCTHSCCVGWEIDIDRETLEKYEALKGGYGENIIKSIDTEDTPHFRLRENERCPHLDRAGLCKIILSLGEDYLCDICREHPRFYNYSPRGLEVGLGMACEEACRLIISSDGYAEFEDIDGEDAYFDENGFDTVSERKRIYDILSDRKTPYEERIKIICREYEIDLLSCENAVKDLIFGMEYLDGKSRELFSKYSADIGTPKNFEEALERIFAYFIFRHCTEARDKEEYRASLGMCAVLERLVASVIKYGEKEVSDAARTVSEEIEYSEDNTNSLISLFFSGGRTKCLTAK